MLLVKGLVPEMGSSLLFCQFHGAMGLVHRRAKVLAGQCVSGLAGRSLGDEDWLAR